MKKAHDPGTANTLNSFFAVHRQVLRYADDEKARLLKRFFKTGPGEYGEGDEFLGVMVPVSRLIARRALTLPAREHARLLRSPAHEERLIALLIWVERYGRSEVDRAKIFSAYLKSTRFINNWDLVDVSAPRIVGRHLEQRSRAPLYRLVRSRSLWERRIAIISTLYFISNGQFDDTLALSEALLGDREPLLHKACGWMLREVGKRDPKRLKAFLKEHCASMPRTMLRYAVERLPEKERRRFMMRG